MNIVNATNARKEFFSLIDSVANDHKVYHIQHRKNATVLISEDDYESLLETLELLSQPGLIKSLNKSIQQAKKGQTVSMKNVFGKNK